MEPRGRGRARGRARDGPSSRGPQAPRDQGRQERPGPPQQQPPSQQQAWSRPAMVPATQSQEAMGLRGAHYVRPQMPAPAPASVSVGRGSRLGTEVEATSAMEVAGAISSGGSGEPTRGRGGPETAVRGRTNRGEIIRTRHEDLQSKKGNSGAPIQLMSNYFQLIGAGKWSLYQYRCDFQPDIDNMGQRKGLMRDATADVVSGYLFDGSLLFTPFRLHPDNIEKVVHTQNNEAVHVNIRLVGDLSWGDRTYLQLFNIIMRKCLSYMKFQLIQRDYYDPQHKVTLPEHKFEIWPGYFTSIRQHECNILLNCEMKFKIMRTETVYDALCACKGGNTQKEFQSMVIGSIVLTTYNNKTYRIDDVDFNTTPASTFPKKDGTSISFIEYYQKVYGIKIKVPNQPMLVSRSKPREIRAGMPETVLLVPELCCLTGLTDRQRENFQLMRALAEHTRVGADKRIKKLREFSSRLLRCPEAVNELKRWDLRFTEDLVRFQGRVLPAEQIVAGNNAKYSAGAEAEWTRELRSKPVLVIGQMNRLAVIVPSQYKSKCEDFMRALVKAGGGMSINLSNYRIMEIQNDRSHSYLDSIEAVIQSSNPSMIMCVLPNNSSDRYSAIKKKCYVDRGIPSQVMLVKNLTSQKGSVMSIATKIAIQMNCKVGGAPWTVIIPMQHLMVVGYDVCRDTANKGLSFSAMVASLDRQLTRYFSYTFQHRLEEELSDHIAAFLILACTKYKELNGRFPAQIIIYRDGVGDGQLPYVIEHEVETVKRKLKAEIYKTEDLKMAFVVVSKRINTRIFTHQEKNPPPGTVVDDVVTLPERYDFFIVAQCVKQGTVTPTSYNVIFNEVGLTPDRMQMLTYKLCHMYYNWSGTVRVPAPVQYAHKCAFLTAQSLHRSANRALETLAYYL